MRLLNIIPLLLFSFSLLGQWLDYDSVGATVSSINKVSFPTANTGYVLGVENGSFDETIYKTIDGADSWTNLNYPTTNNPDIQNIHFIDAQTGFLSVRETPSSNLTMQVYKTTDGGQNWTNISPTTPTVGYGTSAVHFVDVDTGFFSLENLVFRTHNSGQSWAVDTISSMYHDIQHIDFWDGQYGVAGGWDGTFAYSGILFYTNDGGLIWNEVIIPQTYTTIVDVQRVSSTHIFALGDDGFATAPYLYRSTNAGASWDTLNLSQYAVNNQDNFNNLFFEDENNGYMGTSTGNILKTTDAGLTWSVVYSFGGQFPSVSDIAVSGSVGYAFSTDGKVAKTSSNTAIQNIQVSQAISGFPNPSINSYHLDLGSISKAKSINIYSAEGRLVFNLSFPKVQQVINTQNWPLGFYVGTVETEKGEFYHFKLQKN